MLRVSETIESLGWPSHCCFMLSRHACAWRQSLVMRLAVMTRLALLYRKAFRVAGRGGPGRWVGRAWSFSCRTARTEIGLMRRLLTSPPSEWTAGCCLPPRRTPRRRVEKPWTKPRAKPSTRPCPALWAWYSIASASQSARPSSSMLPTMATWWWRRVTGAGF